MIKIACPLRGSAGRIWDPCGDFWWLGTRLPTSNVGDNDGIIPNLSVMARGYELLIIITNG
jgi:hypothetical protein